MCDWPASFRRDPVSMFGIRPPNRSCVSRPAILLHLAIFSTDSYPVHFWQHGSWRQPCGRSLSSLDRCGAQRPAARTANAAAEGAEAGLRGKFEAALAHGVGRLRADVSCLGAYTKIVSNVTFHWKNESRIESKMPLMIYIRLPST